MPSGRGPKPSESTLRILCGKAAGMCQFDGCDKRLFYDAVTLSQFYTAYVAHIVASSPKGVRGDPVRSHQLSDKLENLMLMCDTHHKLIDDSKTGARAYPEAKLLEMKKQHEEKLDTICKLMAIPETEIVTFASPIKGTTPVSVDYKLAANAVLPSRKPSSLFERFAVDIKSVHAYKSGEYWDDVSKQLKEECFQIKRFVERHANAHLSVFPIGPIPLLIKLGETLGDKINIDIYQKTRTPDTWAWQSDMITNEFTLGERTTDNESRIALILALTSDISEDRIMAINNFGTIYKIKAQRNDVDSIKSSADLSEFWHLYQSVMDNIVNRYRQNCQVHLFSSIPVSAAFEVGRRFMPKVHPQIVVYDDDGGFFEALRIGE